MKVIAVSGFKGGVGKSVSAIHVAKFFGTKGKTLLIDSDPNRSCLRWYERSPIEHPFKVVNEKGAVSFIPGNDFLVLDTPARPSSDELKEISQGADITLLPTIPDAFSLQAMLSMIPMLHQESVYRCLLTVCPPPPSKEATSVRDCLIEAKIPLLKAQIRRAAGFTKAIAQGVTVADLTGRDRMAWRDYQSIGTEVEEILNAN
ncbi:ParA family protein [Acaryochloris marina]|uniref:Chromosome partitioning protein, ParA family, putative n=1 Tax=Acaryochloris marina (strain MBIC 11017) TaxID=329726 RepID=A8ZLL5_ACAM1|nr:ParA family protein [Acaryochloris marina]ABW32042.1 chromosome partitioning protein, ParA family, putative [Acaryochloris marina MBIC11017]BDM83143.1 chromosome partitioning protein ParA [Acaryochloris marina MBIC10699]